MRHRMIIAAIGLAALIVPVAAATAQIQTPRRERVTLAAGSTSTTIKGAIRSHESIDYLVGVKAGQPLTVAMTASNASARFNILPEGSRAMQQAAGSPLAPARRSRCRPISVAGNAFFMAPMPPQGVLLWPLLGVRCSKRAPK